MENTFLRSVERFVAVADHGSIQAAANALNLSQPSLTHALSKIEEGFGTRLFERTKRGVVLTRSGELLYPRAKAILREGSMASQEIADHIGGRHGSLRIRAGSVWGYCLLPRIVADIKRTYPKLEIEMNIGNTAESLVELGAGNIEAVVGKVERESLTPPGVELQTLADIRFVLICNASHPIGAKKNVSLNDLTDVDFVAYKPDVDTLRTMSAPLEAALNSSLNIAVTTRSPHAALELVKTGEFVACMSEPFVRKYEEADLCVRELDFELPTFLTGVYYRGTLTPTDPFKMLLQHLKKGAAELNARGS